jgi:pimeloyl-ACP methyl ester carboxylesterase
LHVTRGPYGFDASVAERFWRRIPFEVLLVEGAVTEMRLPEDELARREAAFLRRKKRIIPGAGHMMQRHRPAELAAILVEYLS